MIAILRYAVLMTVVAATRAGAEARTLADAVHSEMVQWHSPGAAMAVVRDGRLVIAEGCGLADVARNTAATADTVFAIGSMTKQFTAAAALLLVEDGRIGLDAPAARFLPALPPAYRDVTVRQMLEHTSGIPRDLRDDDGDSLVGNALFEKLAAEPLAFPPGQRAAYSNTEYILLGMMVEAQAGEGLASFLAERVFSPLGMRSTRFVRPGLALSGAAKGYEWMDGELQELTSIPARYGAGGIVSSASDLARWAAALDRGEVLRPESRAAMWKGASLPDGRPATIGTDDAGRLLQAAMGWHLSTDHGHRVIHHGGNIDGFSAQIDRFPDDRLTIVVLANNEAHAAINIARPVREHYLAGGAPVAACENTR
jgi:CubicO group peptidase (beta-lactamase class C family)